MRYATLAASSLLLALLLAACHAPERDRTDEIVGALMLADRGLLEDRAALVQQKYEKMGEHAYNFARGSLPLYHHDLERHPDLLERIGSEVVLTNGDPHPENLGTFGGSSGVLVDWNDHDAAGSGHATHDLIRLGYTLAVFIAETTGEPAGDVVDEMLEGYHPTPPTDGGLIIADLAKRALKKGEERDELDDVMMGIAGPVFERDGDELVDAEAQVASELLQALPAYAPTRVPGAPALGPMRDVVKVLGKGVTSVPLDRYRVLIAGAEPDGSQDRVIELKEAWDGSVDDRGRLVGSQAFVADRIVASARALGAGPALDVDLGVLLAGGKAFVVKGESGYAQDLDFDRIKEKWEEVEYQRDDLLALARFMGGTLALAHHRGGISTTRLDERAHVREAILFFASRARKDHALFQARLAEGPVVDGS